VTENPGDGTVRPVLPQLRLDELLDELQVRVQAIRSTRDRVHSLLDAVLAVGSDLELEQVLHRIVEAAVALVDARYGALGVIGDGGEQLSRFLTVGVEPEQIDAIGPYPHGRGILGELIRHPVKLRLADLAAHPASYGFPANHPPMKTFLGVPIRVRDEVFGNLYITEKRGGAQFDVEDEQLLSTLAAAAGVAIDNARLYEDAQRRERWLRASSDITRRLLSGSDPAEVLRLFAAEAQEMAEADLVAIAVPVAGAGASTESLVIEVAAGVGADEVRGSVLPITASLSGSVYTSGVAINTADLRTDERAHDTFDLSGRIGPMLTAPLGGPERIRGVLLVGREHGRLPFARPTAEMITAFSGQAAIALELAERRRDAERLTVFEDRDRIARDLHDLAIQRLFATGMTLEGASRLIGDPQVAARVVRAVDDLDETIKVIRSTIFALQARDTELDRAGLRARVLAEAEAAAAGLGFTPALRLDGLIDARVPDEVAEHVIAVLREALSNVARHAHASRVEVRLTVDTDTTLRVADDGVGLPAGGHRSGLRNLAERAERLGGTLTVGPGQVKGTVLEWRIPLGPDHPAG
jgi:signal transduction histidine kinase